MCRSDVALELVSFAYSWVCYVSVAVDGLREATWDWCYTQSTRVALIGTNVPKRGFGATWRSLGLIWAHVEMNGMWVGVGVTIDASCQWISGSCNGLRVGANWTLRPVEIARLTKAQDQHCHFGSLIIGSGHPFVVSSIVKRMCRDFAQHAMSYE